MGNKRGLLVLGILCCLATTQGEKKKCYTGCHGSSGSFYNYEEGTNYKYKLDGSTITTIAGAQNDVSKLSISADVEISAQPQCSYVLKISHVTVSGPDGKKHSSLNELEAHPVRFSFHDGHVESEVCSEEGDTNDALNIKRAIISLFQSTVHKESGSSSHYETDVFGTCPTDFEFSKNGNTYKIKKSRNLNQCAHRENLNFPVYSSSYSLNSDFQSSPILSSGLKVEQQIQDGIVLSAAGEEHYNYQPHLSIESGATVTVKTKLVFVSQAKGAAIAANVNTPKTIIFEAPHEEAYSSSVQTIESALQKAASAVEPTVQPSAAEDFSNLVEVLSQSKKADILSVYASAKDTDTSKKILLDGITRASSGDAVEVLAELVQANQLTKLQKGFWILNLGFIKHVTKSSLKAVLPLLNDAPRFAYLGVGSLAGRYCSQHECESVPEYKELLAKLAAPVTAGCTAQGIDNENTLIASLKGLRNAGHLTNAVAAKVAKCATDKSVKTRVRVAALETFLSDASQDKIREAAVAILKDQTEDSEVRIKAYLSLVECPCNKVADVVKNVLDSEKVNQVGSFIVSHLRNLRSSTNPDKAHAKHFLGQIYTKNKFPIDIRKFSNNQELSYSVDAVNLGAAGESNVIFSQKSFFPRSVSLNLTTQIFGHAFNLFEVNARSENVDYLLEKYFGPKGYFPTHNPHDIFDNVYKSTSSIADKIKERYENTVRPKRSLLSIQQRTDAFAKNVILPAETYDNDLDLDLSLKFFGSEVGWFSYSGSNKELNPNSIIDKIFNNIDESIDKAKNLDVDYKKHATFLDAEAVYPTGLGFPLKVNTKGSSALRVKVDGKIDLPAIIKDPKNAHIKFQLIPSAAIELSGQLSIDAYVVEAGAKVSGNIHTATGSDLSIKFLEGSGIDVKFGLPVKKQDVISFKSHIVAIAKEKGQAKVETPIKFNVKRHEYKGCFDQLNTLIGLTFCGDVSFPFDGTRALSPSYGPTSISAHIEKDDDSLTAYHFKAFLNKKDPNQAVFEILLDTPNSNTNRKISFIVDATKLPNKKVSAVFTTPWKIVSFEGQVTQNDKEQSIAAKLLHDGTEYSAKAGVTVEGDENHKVFKPLLEYKAPDFKVEKKGLIGVKGGSRSDKSQRAVAVDGVITLDKGADGKRTYNLQQVTVTTPRTQYIIDGTVSHDNDQIETDIKVAYEKETFKLKSKLSKALTENSKKAKAYIEFIPSQYPDFGVVINYEGELDRSSGKKIENKISITHGSDPNSPDSKITIYQFLKFFYENCHNFDYATKNSISYPLVGLTGQIEGEAKPSSISYLLDGTYTQHQISSSLKARTGVAKKGDYEIDFKGKILDNSIELQAKREIITDTKSKFTNSLDTKPGGKYQFNAIVNHNFQKENFHNHIHADIKLPAEPKSVIKFDAGIKNNKKDFLSEFKVVAGEKQYILFEAKVQKEKPSGSFIANLPPNFDSHGSFAVDGGKGSGSFEFNFPKQERKIEGKGEIAISGSKHTGFVDICWDAIKNPTKSIKIETDSDCKPNSVESKNTITYLGEHKTVLNFKGNVAEQPNEEAVQTEAELILPSGRKYTGKYNGKYSHQTDDYDGEIEAELAHYAAAGSQPTKIAFKVNGKNINPAKRTIDGQATISFVSQDGSDVKAHSVLKKVLNGEKWTINGQAALSGSKIKYPINAKLDTEISDQFIRSFYISSDRSFPPASYHLTATVGSEFSVDSNGKVNQHQINNEVDFKFPADYSVKTFKWTSTNYVDPADKIKTNNAIHWNGDKFFKVIAEGNKEENGVTGKVEWESHAKSPRSLSGSAHYNPSENGDKKFDGSVIFAYEGKNADVNLKAEYIKQSELAQVQLSGNLPQQGKFDISVKNQGTNGGKGFKTDVNLVVNEKKITVTNHVELDPENPLLDLVAEHPQGKSRVFLKLEKKGERHWSGESKVKWVGNGGGNLAIDGEAKFDSVDDFFIKVNADSPKLKVEKYHVEVANRPTKGTAKKITFQAKSADKVLFSGSTTYNFKEDGQTRTLDGNGNIKIGDKPHPLKFKYIREELTKGADGEDGNQVKIHVTFGKSTYDLQGRLSATNFHIKRKYCKEDADCSTSEISSKVKKYSLQEYDYEFYVNLDLNKIFKDTEDLSLKIVTKRNGFIFDHNFELQRNPESKIKYQIYVHENQAGAVLTLPKRVMAAEATYEIPKNKKHGLLQIEGALWLNKQKAPTEKTALAITADIARSGEGGSFTGEVRASHPALGKDLVIKGHTTIFDNWNKIVDAKIEFDIFAKKEQKISIQYKSQKSKEKEAFSAQETFNVKGLIEFECKRQLSATKANHVSYTYGCSYIDGAKNKQEAVSKFELSASKFNYIFKIPEGTLFAVDYKKKGSANNYHFDGTYEILGEKYGESIEIKNQNNLKYVFIFDKGGKNKKFETEFGFAIGQVAEFKSSYDSKELGNLQVALDDGHFLQSKYSFNTNNFKEFIEVLRGTYVGILKKHNKIFQEALDRISKDVVHEVEEVQKALPNFSPVVKAYTEQIEALQQEVVNEKSIQEAADYIKGVLGVILEQVVVILEEVAKATESILAVFNEGTTKFKEALKRLIPHITESYEKITKVVINVFEESLKYSVEVANFVLDKIREHEDEIQAIVSAITEFASEIGQLAAKSFVHIRKHVEEFVDLFVEQIKALPIFAMLKEKFEEFSKNGIPEELWNDYHEVIRQVQEILPTPECGQFFVSVSTYIEKLLRNQPVDNAETLKTLYKELVAAFNSIVTFVQAHIPQDKLVQPYYTYIPLPTLSIFRIPKGAFRFSLLAWFRSEDIPSVADIFYTYKPTINPLNYIPPYKANAYLVYGSDFFTFDREHIQLKGDCTYVLAQDFVDGNFSITAKVSGGKVESVTLSDKTDSVELTRKQTVYVNGAAAEFPIKQGDLHGWRRYTTANVYHNAGARILCTTDLHFCSFHLSGFYFGKTKGLFGTINNEQYDELSLPSGAIASQLTEFTNAYALDGCSGSAVEEHNTPSSQCTALFNGDSTLSGCYPYVDPHHYRHACNHIASHKSNDEEKESVACEVAYAYYEACSNVHETVSIPSECIKCNVAGKILEEDGETTVTTPQTSADIVLVVEEVAENEEVFNALVTPLVHSITKDFKEQGITDVHFSLIGFGAPGTKWPQHYTTNGKIDFNSKSSITFSKQAAPEETKTEHKYITKLKELKHKFDVEFGNTQVVLAFTEASDYPFRPDAVKAIIGVLAGPCEKSVLPVSLQQARMIWSLVTHKISGVEFHLITNVNNLQHVDEKVTPNIVGFSNERVYLFSDAKKKSNDVSPYSLTYTPDICITFTRISGGSVFNSANFVGAKPDARKQFVNVAASGITESLGTKKSSIEVTCSQKNGRAHTELFVDEIEARELLQKGIKGVKG